MTEPTAADEPLMRRIVTKAMTEPHRGLPSHMRDGLREAGRQYLTDGMVMNYWFVCLFAAQSRPGGEPRAVIELRLELERIFFQLLYGNGG